MLVEAGGDTLAGKVDATTVAKALSDVETCCIQARGGT